MKVSNQIIVDSEGNVTSVRCTELLSKEVLRELINQVIDERERIKELENEVRELNNRIAVSKIMNNPNKYKSEK